MRIALVALVLAACGGSPVVGADVGSTVELDGGRRYERCAADCVPSCMGREGAGPGCASATDPVGCVTCGPHCGDPSASGDFMLCSTETSTPACAVTTSTVSCWRVAP